MDKAQTNNSEEKVSLISTLEKTDTKKLSINLQCSYLIKEFTIKNSITIQTLEHSFSNGNTLENKMSARVFYDGKLIEFEDNLLVESNTELIEKRLELYLVINPNDINEEKLLILSTDKDENVINKNLESRILNADLNSISKKIIITDDSVTTKNSFLDSHYKD